MVSKVYMICNAYESGYGHGLDGQDDYCNPYKESTDEHEAYAIGRDEGSKRRASNEKRYAAMDTERKFYRHQLVRHVKTRGIYEIIGYGKIEKDQTPVAIYEQVYEGRVWVRPIEEFEDGRFELAEFNK
jgi:hypothetical protein